MTTKQIAESLGKPERTVRDWVKSLAAKSAVIAAKLAASSPMKPADYDLDETCQIIEEGLGPDVANTFRTNATYAALEQAAPRALPAPFQGIEATAFLLDRTIRAYELGLITKAQSSVLLGFAKPIPALEAPLPETGPYTKAQILSVVPMSDANLRTILHRNPEFRHPPYSDLFGKERRYYPAILSHLAERYGTFASHNGY